MQFSEVCNNELGSICLTLNHKLSSFTPEKGVIDDFDVIINGQVTDMAIYAVIRKMIEKEMNLPTGLKVGIDKLRFGNSKL